MPPNAAPHVVRIHSLRVRLPASVSPERARAFGASVERELEHYLADLAPLEVAHRAGATIALQLSHPGQLDALAAEVGRAVAAQLRAG